MASKTVHSRLSHLHKSADLLAASSPAISAFLESQRAWVAATTDTKLPVAGRLIVCESCGHRVIFGWRMQSKTSTQSKRRRLSTDVNQPSEKRGKTPKIMVAECTRCSYKKVVDVPDQQVTPSSRNKRGPKQNSAPTIAKPIILDLPQEHSAAPRPSDVPTQEKPKSSSKERAKARKQRGRLQTMLTTSRADTERAQSKDYGLDLMDLLQKD
ncbi:MAG: hypothetical protein M1820_008191 [Bogoriella megaspora]|nr:MAG: hypothetical protein M1820_008191 [Bogoriella megaspora]